MNRPAMMIGHLPDDVVRMLLRGGCHVLIGPEQFARLFPGLDKAVIWKTAGQLLEAE